MGIMKSVLGPFDKSQVEEMLRRGCQTPEIVQLFLNRGKNPAKKTEFAARMERLLNGQLLPPQEVLEMMRKQLGSAGQKELEEMLARGCSLHEILDNFIHKPSELAPPDEETEFAKRIKQLMGDKTLSAEQMMNLIKSQLDPNGQLQLDEMRRCGCSHDEIINHFMNREKNKKGQKRNE